MYRPASRRRRGPLFAVGVGLAVCAMTIIAACSGCISGTAVPQQTTLVVRTMPATPALLAPARQIQAITEVHVRTGPSEHFPIVGSVAGGQIVVGQLVDGVEWYRLGAGRYVSAAVVSIFRQ